jgi:NAD(P)-dependent dehydrogenase (short-subunit alcohol dehydrogenase family)
VRARESVNTVSPGTIATELSRKATPDFTYVESNTCVAPAALAPFRLPCRFLPRPHFTSRLIARPPADRPLGRVGDPDDVASLVLFLAGEGARWITGQNIPVDGGITIKGGWAPLIAP